jgi:hypothetical protein
VPAFAVFGDMMDRDDVVDAACTKQVRSADSVEYSEIGDDCELSTLVCANELSCSYTNLDKNSPPSHRPT